MTDTPKPFHTHREKRRASQAAKIEQLFGGKTFDIVKEIHLPIGQVFQTVLGNKGRHGWIIQDRATGERFVVGWTILQAIHDRFLGVNLPKCPYPYREPGNTD